MKFKWFCKHKYKVLGELPCSFEFKNDLVTRVPITFLECKKCGKRSLIRDKDWYYNRDLLKKLNLWLKGEIDLSFTKDNVYYEDFGA